MVTMYVNVHVTRRKDFIIIQDGDENVLWTGQKTFAAFAWLLDAEIYNFHLSDGESEIRVMIGRKPVAAADPTPAPA